MNEAQREPQHQCPDTHSVRLCKGKGVRDNEPANVTTSVGAIEKRLLQEPLRLTLTQAELSTPEGKEAKKALPYIIGGPSNLVVTEKPRKAQDGTLHMVPSGWREAENFSERDIVTLDVDTATSEFLDHLRAGTGALAGMRYAWHKTVSSTPVCPKLRIFLWPEKPMTAAQHRIVVDGLKLAIEGQHRGVYVDPTCGDIAHIMFVPAVCADSEHATGSNPGAFLDVERFAAVAEAATAEGKQQAEQMQGETKHQREQAHTGGYQDDGPVIQSRWREVLAGLGVLTEGAWSPKAAMASECPTCGPDTARCDWTEDGLWTCRVCGKGSGGNVVTFVKQHENIDGNAAFDRCRELLGMPSRTRSGGSGATQSPAPAIGADAVIELAGKAQTPDEKTAALSQWRALSPDARAVTRKTVSKALGMTASEMQGPKAGEDEPPPVVRAHDPAGTPQDGAELLNDIVAMLTDYVALPPFAPEAVALWVLHTHGSVEGLFRIAPLLNLISPLPRCGKTTLFELLEDMVARPWLTVGATNATLFRVIHGYTPTLLLDEVDQLFKDPKAHGDVIATLNAGHRRGASVPRCVGDDFTVKAFNVFCPKALAGIHELPPTLADRSIKIRMQRRAPGQTVRRRTPDTTTQAWALGERATRWTADNAEALRQAADQLPRPEELSDREADGWAPLFAVAHVAGGRWPAHAIRSALALSACGDTSPAHVENAVLLLGDIRTVYAEDRDGRTNLTTEYITAKLKAMDERPWMLWSKGRGMDSRALGKMLAEFQISSTTVRSGDNRGKGYRRGDFEEAWNAYLAPEQARESVETMFSRYLDVSEGDTVTTALNAGKAAKTERDNNENVTDDFKQKAGFLSSCHPVTFKNPESGERKETEPFSPTDSPEPSSADETL